MPYNMIHRLLSNEYSDLAETVLIESCFDETTRHGTKLQQLQIALTPTKFIIASRSRSIEEFTDSYHNWISSPSEKTRYELRSVCPLNAVLLKVFKHSRRQSIKASFSNNKTRYFDLGYFEQRTRFWNLWCQHILEINTHSQVWPYEVLIEDNLDAFPSQMREHYKRRKINRWTDKNLFLGSKRYVEDQNKPVPVPGLGKTEEQIQFHLKASGAEQLENSSTVEQICYNSDDYIQDVYTYTGEPTSNITYTSIMTTVNSGSNHEGVLVMASLIKFSVQVFSMCYSTNGYSMYNKKN